MLRPGSRSEASYRSYSDSDLERLQERFAAALAEGRPAGSPEVMDLAEEHRQQLDHWFFDYDARMHLRIGDLYVDDPK